MRRLSVTMLVGAALVVSALSAPRASADPAPALSSVPHPYAPRGVDPSLRAAIDKQRVRLTTPVRAPLRTKIAAASRLLLQRMSEPPPENTKPLDPLQHARKIVSDASSFNTAGYSSADIEAMIFIVLMEATKSAEDDLKNVMAAVEAINAAKPCLQEAKNDKTKAKKCISSLVPTPTMTKAQLDMLKDRIDGSLDSLSEMSEQESLRLQMAMDRLSKLMSTLSNLMKKIESTSSDITRNLK